MKIATMKIKIFQRFDSFNSGLSSTKVTFKQMQEH
jgi:hypothetical protein